MRNLSKSKLLAYRQCPKRLWLEIHKAELREDSAATQASFNIGHQVGDIARRLYDPDGKGQLIDPQSEGFAAAFTRTTELLTTAQPIFEAGFCSGGALAFADVMLPIKKGRKLTWRMVEVKSSTSVKDNYRDDAAIQAFIARSSGVDLESISLAHIDNKWVYPGGGDYAGLLVENDLSAEAFDRESEVKSWIAEAQTIVSMTDEPEMGTGHHCDKPYECGFYDYCASHEPQAEYPVSWLPRIQAKALKATIEEEGIIDLRDVPDKLLNDKQCRVKRHTLSGDVYFDAKNAEAALAPHKLPAYFIDFETIQFAVPIWAGTRPYQQIPFQFSCHRLSSNGKLEHDAFLDLSGGDPSNAFASSLIEACGESGPVFVYNAAFEKTRIKELAERFTDLKQALLAINKRVVDLLPVAEKHFYHPSQHGSWSIKKVLPAVAPELRYDALEGVQDGGMAMTAFMEAVSPETTLDRKTQIEQQLLDYCALDTYAMVRLWKFFAGQSELDI